MNRGKIKIELANYLDIETQATFRNYQEKVSSIISSLYNSKSEISKMTGWLNLPHDQDMYTKIESFSKQIQAEGKYEHLLVLGIGGSSLGAQALIESINSPLWNRLSKGKRKGFLPIDFIDNLDPTIIRTVLSRLKLDKTLFLVISKAGSTLETIVPMLIAREWAGENFYKNSVFITGNNQGILSKLAQKHSVKTFVLSENIGGRYSVFSPVGLVPAALCGVDINEIREGILEADRLCKESDLKTNLAAQIALCAFFSYTGGKNIFTLMPYSTCLRRFVDWFVQLWAESLGKSKKGSTPIVSIGATDQHSQLQMFSEGPDDKLICFIKVNKHKRDLTIPDFSSEDPSFASYSNHKVGQVLNIELEATKRALTESRKPNFTLTLPELDEYYIAQLMYIFEVATAIAGNLLGVNPFDQPGVELTKRYTKEMLN
ncbi:MAG: glucose-6-phosphate isomerase [bacterium]|nr:MAG: glucose-6-phosphate isomerase [bacterium]